MLILQEKKTTWECKQKRANSPREKVNFEEFYVNQKVSMEVEHPKLSIALEHTKVVNFNGIQKLSIAKVHAMVFICY